MLVKKEGSGIGSRLITSKPQSSASRDGPSRLTSSTRSSKSTEAKIVMSRYNCSSKLPAHTAPGIFFIAQVVDREYKMEDKFVRSRDKSMYDT